MVPAVVVFENVVDLVVAVVVVVVVIVVVVVVVVVPLAVAVVDVKVAAVLAVVVLVVIAVEGADANDRELKPDAAVAVVEMVLGVFEGKAREMSVKGSNFEDLDLQFMHWRLLRSTPPKKGWTALKASECFSTTGISLSFFCRFGKRYVSTFFKIVSMRSRRNLQTLARHVADDFGKL